MSVYHSFYGKFDLQFTESNVRFIVQKAFDVGIRYIAVENFSETGQMLNVDEAVLKLLTITEEIKNDGGPFLRGKFQDTGISIWMCENNNKIEICFGSFWYQWDKDFSNGIRLFTIDFSRYIRLMLQICKDLTLLDLYTFTDELNNIFYEEIKCVTAIVDIGFFGQKASGYPNDGKLSIKYFSCNATQNDFIFFDENTQQLIEPSIQKYYEILEAEFPAYLYAKKDDISFKIKIQQNVHGYDRVSIYPLEPYRMKKGYGSEEEKIDVAFYVERLLELCENFAIYELKTFF